MDLKAADILLLEAAKWEKIIGRIHYGHVVMYYTETKLGLPLIIESTGRGVAIHSLYVYTGKTVSIKRDAALTDPLAQSVADAAEHLADNPASWYDYWAIPRYCIPKILLQRLGNLLPQRWTAILKLLAFTYRANKFYICSELIDQAYRNAGFPLVDGRTIPLPDDIADSSLLTDVGTMTISLGGLKR